MLILFLCAEFLLYISRAAFIFIWGVSLTHPMLASFLFGEFLLHILCWLHFYLGSFFYTSHAGFIFLWGVSLKHPELALILCVFFFLHIMCWFFMWGVSLNILCCLYIYVASFSFLLPSFLPGKFLLHILCWLHFYRGSFSYTSRAGFIFMWGVSLTHPMLASFYAGSFSYTSRADFFFMWGVSLTHPVLDLFLMWVASLACRLLGRQSLKKRAGSWPRRKVWKSHTQTKEGSPRTTWTEQNKTKRELIEKWAQE